MHLNPRSFQCALLITLIAAFSGWALTASAADRKAGAPGTAKVREYSEFEKERIRRALARVKGVIDPNPQGKRIEAIQVVALEVFEPEDKIPTFINWFHPTTRHYVIEREALLRVGAPFDQRRSDETERNIRDLRLFSLVVALPLQGSRPDTVRYLIVTKDLWSLRVSWTGRINQGVVDQLSLTPSETNLFGTGRQLFSTISFTRRTYSLGGGFVEPRLGGSRYRIAVDGRAISSCETGDVEGSVGNFSYTYPLFSTTSRWGYATSVGWSNGRVLREVVNNLRGSICSAKTDEEIGVSLRNGKVALIPGYYEADTQSFTQSFVRSFGYRYKLNLGFGLEARRSAYTGADVSRVRAGPSEVPGELTESERDAAIRFYQRLPRGEQRISPYFSISTFSTDFHRDINVQSLSLQEDFSLGPGAGLKIYPAFEALGSTRNLLGLNTSASYSALVRGTYVSASIAHNVQLSSPERTDALLSAALRLVSPRLGFGRFVYLTQLIDHYRNYTGGAYTLGGTGLLRGYQATATSGEHYFTSNLEFRTLPIQIFSAQIAGVLFHDMGDTFDSFGGIDLLHGVGAGLRFLIPQLDRDVFRIDLGLPVPLDEQYGELSVMATFEQAY